VPRTRAAEPCRGERACVRVEMRRDAHTRRFLFGLYIPYPCHFFLLRDTTHQSSSHLFLSSCSLVYPHPKPLRAKRSGEQAPDALHRDTCSGVRAIRFLGSIFRDCSLPGIGEIGYFLLPRIGFFLVASRDRLVRLLPGGLWSATSSCIDCGLLL